MASAQFNAGQTQGQAQGKAEEWTDAAKSKASEASDKTRSAASATADKARSATDATKNAAGAASDKAASTANSTQQTAVNSKDQSAGFLQQTGEQVINMAQGALDGVKNTLGVARREVSPRTKDSSRNLWRNASNSVDFFGLKCEASTDARRNLVSWVEADSLQHLSAKYCPLVPPPRSTIAAAFSADGKTLASTHGDHTVKIIDCQTGKCLKVLSGHRRTPWVVRFHPLCPEVLASGSLDHEVRLWDANTAECIGSRDFYRPIASIAFHAEGEFIAVASGHKLYIWKYSRKGDSSPPAIILKTRRSLRAVHFHPHAAPYLLTAELHELESSDSSMTLATSPGYLRYPPPTVYLADANSSQQRSNNFAHELPITSLPIFMWPSATRNPSQQTENTQERLDTSASVRLLTYSTPSGQYELLLSPIDSTNPPSQQEEPQISDNNVMETEPTNQFLPLVDSTHWELPFLQGWLIGQSQAGQQTVQPGDQVGSSERPGSSRQRSSGQPEESGSQTAEIASSLAAAAAAELPCTVKLRIWPHDVEDPCAMLDSDKCRLIIPHAVLCSEMGAHFSPCGRFLAACVACVLPNMEADPGFHGQIHQDVTGAATSPTRHPISAHQVLYELRIYSLEEATFGSVLSSRAIRAAHCLTSIQFSPTSEHLLLAYGRRHSSLLKSVVIDGETTVSIYTILEVYRVCDMELVRVLPSSEDEVNVACFHPSIGGGLVYGTKEGKLRILQYDFSQGLTYTAPSSSDQNMLEIPTYASED